MRVETLESSRESMRVFESWPNESESCREFVEGFTCKQKRELENHPGKTLSDVNNWRLSSRYIQPWCGPLSPKPTSFNKLISVFHEFVLLSIMNFVITLSK